MSSVRLEVSTMLEKLLDKLTALEQYEETLIEIPQVSSVDQLAQVFKFVYKNLINFHIYKLILTYI
jgi:hypothetical protein